MRTYTSSFLNFLRDHQFKIKTITQKEIIKYLASMVERGLSASSGLYGKCLACFLSANGQQKGFELNFPDKVKKVTSVLTMEEYCKY
jgi:hypothetical protein